MDIIHQAMTEALIHQVSVQHDLVDLKSTKNNLRGTGREGGQGAGTKRKRHNISCTGLGYDIYFQD